MRYLLLFVCMAVLAKASAQDSTVKVNNKVVTLKEVVVRSNLNVPAFIDRVKNDTSFYKAFKNLKVLGYTSLNDIRVMDKKGTVKASLESRTRQQVNNGCRHTIVEQQQTTGDMLDKTGNWNYYTVEMYAGLFWAKDTICGENNTVGDLSFNLKNKSGAAKHREQLKMLFFNPGKRIPGLPFVGNKLALFDDDMANYYDYNIDLQQLNGEWCYVFDITAKPILTGGQKDKIVINNMTTWFNQQTMDIVLRKYDLSYRAGVYDFDVQIEAELARVGEYLVPTVLRYNGDWDVVFKKRERSVFTATLFDFKK
ncbi:MAG TPA: hypothetical protein VD996_10155 [Chitinophagaceae bacterium]|nr:hypothetical protein [Chitinophagaceae bacterium]